MTTTDLALWALALGLFAVIGEAAWRQGRESVLSSVARTTGLLMLVVATGLFATTLGIEAMVPAVDF